jgi:cytoskeleton-associated protein 5
MMQVIISILLEPEVHQLPDGAQIIRALNVLTVKMIDRSDPTAITCAFIRQLRETVGNTSLSPEYTEMVCGWAGLGWAGLGWAGPGRAGPLKGI